MNASISNNRPAATGHSSYAPYIKARWGLKNHWFPALFSDELKEGEFDATTLCGEPILLRREAGQVHALEDRCCHRGVPLSKKPYCFKEGTVTCWYHGYTYGLGDGELKTIIGSPDDPLIGNASIKTYPVTEAAGMIFVFVGDADFGEPPPLSHDLPPQLREAGEDHYCAHLLNPNTTVRGIRRQGAANWRLASENGFDPGHVLVHQDSPWVYAQDWALPLGFRPVTEHATTTFVENNAPRGILNEYVPGADGVAHYEPVMHNEMLDVSAFGGQNVPAGLRTSMWLPGVLLVENAPYPGMSMYEMYVPIDDQTYQYWELIACETPTPEDETAFVDQYENYLKKAMFNDFNDQDLVARDAMQPFYAQDAGWSAEQLCSLDAVIIGWRKLVAGYARGIQSPPKELSRPRKSRTL